MYIYLSMNADTRPLAYEDKQNRSSDYQKASVAVKNSNHSLLSLQKVYRRLEQLGESWGASNIKLCMRYFTAQEPLGGRETSKVNDTIWGKKKKNEKQKQKQTVMFPPKARKKPKYHSEGIS